jgi:hypothetical protein
MKVTQDKSEGKARTHLGAQEMEEPSASDMAGMRWVPTILPHDKHLAHFCDHSLTIGRDPYSFDTKEIGPDGVETGYMDHYDVTWVCNHCNWEARRRIVYSCRACDFDLCLCCALRNIENNNSAVDSNILSKVYALAQANKGFDANDSTRSEHNFMGMRTRGGNSLVPWADTHGDSLAYAVGKTNQNKMCAYRAPGVIGPCQ